MYLTGRYAPSSAFSLQELHFTADLFITSFANRTKAVASL